MRVLVVGAGGFIGRALCAALADAVQVVGMDLTPAPEALGHLDWVAGSFADGTLMASAADGCDAVIFLANASLPASSQADLAAEAQAHVAATVRVAETCAKLGVGRFLFSSSGGTVYGGDAPEGGLREDASTNPRNGYGVSKLAIEHYLRLLRDMGRIRTLSLRLSNPYGEGQRALRGQGFVAAAMQHAFDGTPLPIWGDGSVSRDFVHVADVAEAFRAALTHDGPSAAINVGSGRETTLNEIVARVREATGLPLPVDYQSDRRIDVQRNALDIARAGAELGWEPRVALPEGLARTADWWRARG